MSGDRKTEAVTSLKELKKLLTEQPKSDVDPSESMIREASPASLTASANKPVLDEDRGAPVPSSEIPTMPMVAEHANEHDSGITAQTHSPDAAVLERELVELKLKLREAAQDISDFQEAQMAFKVEVRNLNRRLANTESRNLAAEEQLKDTVTKSEDLSNKVQQFQEKVHTLRREKRQQADQLKAQTGELKKQLGAISRQLNAAVRANDRLKKGAARGAELVPQLNWLAESLGSNVGFLHPEAVLSGDAPFDAKEFASHLRARGIKSRRTASPLVEVLIVGQSGWTEIELERQIYAREGRILRVYSQELALMSLAVGRDILTDAPREFLLSLAQSHPALTFLARSELSWPDCHPPALPERFEPFEFDRGDVDQSPLKQLGYTVGKTQGLEKKRRQAILRTAFIGEIPWTHSNDYMLEWGQSGTRRRLWRMAQHLAWLSRMWSRMPSHRFAVGDWKDDLAFLRTAFFKPYMRFKWPGMRVPGA